MIPFFKKHDINTGLQEYLNTPNAVLVDVRELEEYNNGYIPGSRNIPLSTIQQIKLEKDRPLFLYCLRGSRSLRAAGILKKMGYTHVKSIGGINRYTEKISVGTQHDIK